MTRLAQCALRVSRFTTALLMTMPFVSGAVLRAQIATLDERVAGAQRVVVATAREVHAEWRENSHGDRLIVSRVQLDVEETLKGQNEPQIWLDVEGGTLDGYTLRVSSLPLMQAGERAVFFLDRGQGTTNVPHLRGQGILFLDDSDVVRNSSLRLTEIRNRARAAQE
jgi:hypothetical protein